MLKEEVIFRTVVEVVKVHENLLVSLNNTI